MADFFVKLINYLIANIGAAITWLIALLPQSPFAKPSAPPAFIQTGLSWLAWLVDIPYMLAMVALLLTAILIWYGVRIAARWLKLAQG